MLGTSETVEVQSGGEACSNHESSTSRELTIVNHDLDSRRRTRAAVGRRPNKAGNKNPVNVCVGTCKRARVSAKLLSNLHLSSFYGVSAADDDWGYIGYKQQREL